MEGLRVTKVVTEIKSEGVWAKLEAKYCFLRQSFTKYLRQTVVFVKYISISISVSIFQQFFAGINKIFILGGRLGTGL